MAFEPVNLAQIYGAAESVKGARNRNALMGQQLQAAQLQNERNKIIFAGRLAQAALNDPRGPSAVFRESLPVFQQALPEDYALVQSSFGPNLEGLSDERAGEMAQHLQTMVNRAAPFMEQTGGIPAELATFNAMTQGLKPEEVEEARRIQLGLSPRASSAAVKTVTFKGADGRERLFLVNAEGSIIGPASEEFVSPTEQQSAHDVALGKGRGQAQADKEKNAPKVRAAMLAAGAKQQRMENVAARILPNINLWTAGFLGSKLAEQPGTPAHDLKQNLSTLQALAGFKELQEMRDNSPTGGALGAITERELELLQATYANIINSQSPEQLRENVQIFIRETQASWNRVRAAYEQEHGSGAAAPQAAQDPLGIRY